MGGLETEACPEHRDRFQQPLRPFPTLILLLQHPQNHKSTEFRFMEGSGDHLAKPLPDVGIPHLSIPDQRPSSLCLKRVPISSLASSSSLQEILPPKSAPV
uniref:Uncharacterized protein n=1 Tax=Micrurus carvalhoi TaxID=3147026 RepID=A0A2H6NIJ5_9SAUR